MEEMKCWKGAVFRKGAAPLDIALLHGSEGLRAGEGPETEK